MHLLSLIKLKVIDLITPIILKFVYVNCHSPARYIYKYIVIHQMLIKDCLRFTFNFYLHIRDVCCWGSLSLLARLSLGCVDGVNDLVEGVGFIILVGEGEVDSGEDSQDCA